MTRRPSARPGCGTFFQASYWEKTKAENPQLSYSSISSFGREQTNRAPGWVRIILEAFQAWTLLFTSLPLGAPGFTEVSVGVSLKGLTAVAPTSRASISHATVIKTNAVKDSRTLLSVKSATRSSAVNKHMSPRESLPLQPCCMQTHYQEYLQKQKSSQPTTWFNYFF